jgi:hypothetical protein
MINLRITDKQGKEREIETQWADLVAFESQFDMPFQRIFGDGKEIRIQYTTWLAHNCEKRTKVTDKNFEEWLENVKIVTFTGIADVPPLETTPSQDK